MVPPALGHRGAFPGKTDGSVLRTLHAPPIPFDGTAMHRRRYPSSLWRLQVNKGHGSEALVFSQCFLVTKFLTLASVCQVSFYLGRFSDI